MLWRHFSSDGQGSCKSAQKAPRLLPPNAPLIRLNMFGDLLTTSLNLGTYRSSLMRLIVSTVSTIGA